ncbi:hypothetical protein OG874_24865 [Nocardia sp. NBC_00565]|uniref:hypothetical protein n=1 Tax=Nocardia sp. NBC_00565 TaxID=2975993 RepID=UPI002E806BD0|nr:hypothetical protein [Nocardia sp. NBC_00565]WUC00134.1 hypothetical protein OG874_24865 [Nocardia sp. NBC_00565]
MSELTPLQPNGELAPSVRALLALFNADTDHKLSLAPVDSQPKVHLADGTLCEVDADGWPDSFDVDAPKVIDVQPIRVDDTEAPAL